MISINDAINNDTWLNCEFNFNDQFCKLRLKLLSFQKLNLNEVDEPEKINMWKDTIIWLMEVEVVNQSKEPMTCGFLSRLYLVNPNSYKFGNSGDFHLNYFSEYSKKKRLDRFAGQFLNPKIKAKGTLIFRMPIIDEPILNISIYDGSIDEA